MNINITLSLDSDVLPALADFLKTVSGTAVTAKPEPKPEAEAEAKPKKKRGRPRKTAAQAIKAMATPEAKADIAAEAAKQEPSMTRDALRGFIGNAIDQLGDEPVREAFSRVGVTKFSEIKDEMVNPIVEHLTSALEAL